MVDHIGAWAFCLQRHLFGYQQVMALALLQQGALCCPAPCLERPGVPKGLFVKAVGQALFSNTQSHKKIHQQIGKCPHRPSELFIITNKEDHNPY